MARGVRHDELAVVGAEEAISHVYGDALFTLCGQAIDQQRKINVAALGALAFGIGLQRRYLIFENQLRFIKHAADKGALAIIYAPAGDETQQIEISLSIYVLLNATFQLLLIDFCRVH